MSDTVLDRYQAFRTRRYLQNEARYAHYLPGWRTRSRRRLLVWILVASLVALVASSVFILVGPEWAPLTWLPGAIVMCVSWTTLQIVTGRRSDAPADALDEWDLQRRNAARSIGFSITQGVVTVPALALVWATTFIDDPRLALGGGFIILSGLIAGSCSPGIILAWTAPIDDPDEFPTLPSHSPEEGPA
ncbi:hypothetical protein HQ305_10810 [Rhodococcus sp. BP-149]|jgi:hypothetical protein|uniref:hypothetical protein n=1 Tax=unclassified Rhodococcus (in: high G+C Gram-positive bacteria) TaxID=192944 RepID=UPI001C9A7CBC|nr:MULTISPECIES: hypothetical protein [unclassified Rhodococcus (in: high G+C Gram-positive bacteria)]MBY6685271.1 hypothetical protein [Rhodococcus sp. BP-288]MBY6695907.1 hypothetical protein [Rhodococcus sp. BP-188]MBY6697027.1 hypothetical protein [Rhodococcus sp. BP-285]MBY6703683.1 hypothetical protein [Rhodococcus sp. BP-283]MBY6710363.1 hypothetical protein [Rhodococcus sp. BP-160]